MVARVATARPLEIAGPAGLLEAAADWPSGDPLAVAVLCHPHPLQQGTMQNKVVTTLSRAFRSLGAAAVRFNFRGAGRSAGRYDDGRGEVDDALAVVRFARAQWPSLPLYLGGFSFGGAIALAAASEAAPRGLLTVALPITRLREHLVLPECRWLLIHGNADDVVEPGPVLAWARALERPPEIQLLDGVGHFFHGRLVDLERRVREFFAADFPPGSPE
jgi:alpha/beta superfamily hydrolase